MTAKEFRNVWLKQNPNTVHIPSEHELGLMEAYAQYYHETKGKTLNKADVIVCANLKDGKCTWFNNGETDCLSILTAKCKWHKR